MYIIKQFNAVEVPIQSKKPRLRISFMVGLLNQPYSLIINLILQNFLYRLLICSGAIIY